MQKGNLGSFADYQRLFFSELEYALETTTLFGQKPQRRSKRKAVIRDFESVPQLIPVAHPSCILVPADGPFCPLPPGQIFMDPGSNRAPHGQVQGLNMYQPATPFLVLNPNQIQGHPACHSSPHTQTTQYQSVAASAQFQRVVQVPGVMSGGPNSALLSGPSAMPGKPPEQPLMIQYIFAPGSEHQRMYHQISDIIGFLPTLTSNTNMSASSMPPRSLSKRSYPESKTTPASQISGEDFSTSMLTVSAPPEKKAKIEHSEDELDVSAMYELLAESTDLQAAIASGEIRIEENTTVAPSPAMPTSTESNNAESLAQHPMFSSSELPVDADQEDIIHETTNSKAQEDEEAVTLEEIFKLDMSETKALFEDSLNDVDLNTMCATYLSHEESPQDNNSLREILESAEFAELFESINDATGIATATESQTTATEGNANPVDTFTTVCTESHPSTTEGLSSVNDDFAELFESLIDSPDFDSYSLTTEVSTSSAGDLAEFSECSVDDTSSNGTILPTETHPSATDGRTSPVDVPEVPPKPRSSMTIEELFLSNRERVLEQVAKQQDQDRLVYQQESLESEVRNLPPSKVDVLEVPEKIISADPFPDYIPDMFLFSTKEPDVRLNTTGTTAPAPTADCHKEQDGTLKVIGQSLIDGMGTLAPPPRSPVEQPVGHYDTVPRGPLDMMRADDYVYFDPVYKAEGFQYVFEEFKVPGNNVIVDPATLQTPRLPSLARKRACSHDNMCHDSQSAKRFKVDAGSWVTCSNPNSDSMTSKKPKRCYNNKTRLPRPPPGDH